METKKPEIQELEALTSVVLCGSITAAALRLNTSKSVISKRISQLETTLGSRLFHRTGRQMRPTDSGLIVYEHATKLLAGITQMADDIASHSGVIRGTLRISGPLSFGNRYLSPLIADFMLAHPEIDVILDLDDRFTDLRAGNYDFSVRIGRLRDSSLRARKLADSPRGIYCSPGWQQQNRLPQTPEQLLNHSLLGYSNARSGHIWNFITAGSHRTLSLNIHPRLLSDSGEVLRDAAISGLGIAALPLFLARDALENGTLCEIQLQGFAMAPDTIYIVYPETVALPARVRVAIDYLVSRMSSLLPDS